MLDKNKLTLGWMKRTGLASGASFEAVDFLIDDTSLFKILNGGNSDLVGIFSPKWKNNDLTGRLFKLEEKSPINDGRILVYGCGECLDIGCGGITMKVELRDDCIVWSDFAFENDYDESMTDRTSYSSVGPFKFSLTEYSHAIDAAAALESVFGEPKITCLGKSI